jgi:type II secretory pathway pseudopilin PulG
MTNVQKVASGGSRHSNLVIDSSFVTRISSFRARGAFTLIELIVVIAIIIVLAGLILSIVGYVQKKGSRSRAETEIAAMSAACESYKADNGIYPRDAITTDVLDTIAETDPNNYRAACQYAYGELTGDRDFDGTTDTGLRSYLSLKPGSLLRDDMSIPPSSSNQVTAIRDPFGNSYGYSTKMAATGGGGYNPTFDLWSTANSADPNHWIKNW